MIEGCKTFIVYTDCSCSCSPDEEDFKETHTLENPIVLKDVTGKQLCKKGGTLKLQVVNSKGDIVTIRTPGYLNPHQSVRILSPQCHFSYVTQKKGSFVMSWAPCVLNIPSMGQIPVHIDSASYMPLLTCFKNSDKVMEQLGNTCISDEVNPLLSKQSKILLNLHYKLGHVGFQRLIWILKTFKVFGNKGILATEGEIPKCASCIHGGQEKHPIYGNKRHQEVQKQGFLKREQLNPGQRIFTDQYICSTPGKNFIGKGHLHTTLSYKGSTIFCDAASGFMRINHQKSFTAH